MRPRCPRVRQLLLRQAWIKESPSSTCSTGANIQRSFPAAAQSGKGMPQGFRNAAAPVQDADHHADVHQGVERNDQEQQRKKRQGQGMQKKPARFSIVR